MQSFPPTLSCASFTSSAIAILRSPHSFEMASIQIRLSFLLLLFHVSVFAAPILLRSSSDNVTHAKRQSVANPMPPLNKNIDLCIDTDGITRSSSNVGNGVPDTSRVSSSLGNALPLRLCDGTGSDTQGALTHTVSLTNSQNMLGTVETSLGQLSGGASTTAPTGSLPGSPVSRISAINLANVNPGSVGSHSVHVISGNGSDGSMGNTEVHLPPLEGLLAIGSGGTTPSGLRPVSQLGSAVGELSGGTILSATGPILANGALGTVNSGILGGRVGSGVPGSVSPHSLDVVSGGGSQGSLGGVEVESAVFRSAIALGTSSNDQSGTPASEGGQSGSTTHDNSPKPNNNPSSEDSNGTPNGRDAPGDNGHGKPNNNAPANSPNADQNSGANGRAPPASNTGPNRPPNSPPNRGPAPNASNSPPPNGPNSAPSDGNRAPVGATNQGGNIAEVGVEVPGSGQHLGVNGLVRQRNM